MGGYYSEGEKNVRHQVCSCSERSVDDKDGLGVFEISKIVKEQSF